MAASETWNTYGCGHVPRAERHELRNEIDRMQQTIAAMVEDANLSATERIARIDGIKQQIWDKKSRIATIKADRRSEKAPPTKLAPIAGEQSPSVKSPPVVGKEHTKPRLQRAVWKAPGKAASERRL